MKLSLAIVCLGGLIGSLLAALPARAQIDLDTPAPFDSTVDYYNGLSTNLMMDSQYDTVLDSIVDSTPAPDPTATTTPTPAPTAAPNPTPPTVSTPAPAKHHGGSHQANHHSGSGSHHANHSAGAHSSNHHRG